MATKINAISNVVEHVRPYAETPAGGWTYHRDFLAHALYRCAGEDEDRETQVTIPDQVAADQRAYDGLAFPTIEGEYVWLDGEAYDLHGSGTGDPIVRDAVAPA